MKLIGIVGGIGSFVWSVWTWKNKSSQELAQLRSDAQRVAENRRIEATKPFLERQLSLYIEASQVAALIASASLTVFDLNEIQQAKKRFWQLYYGELALVENKKVEDAMVEMGDAIREGVDQIKLQRTSLILASAFRRSLDTSWGINAWTDPDEANGSLRGAASVEKHP